MCLKKSDLKKVTPICCNFETNDTQYVSSVHYIVNSTYHTKSLNKIDSFTVPQDSHKLINDFISTLTELNILLPNCIFYFPDLELFEYSFLIRSSCCFDDKKIEKIYRDNILHDITILIDNKELHFIDTKDLLPEVSK